MKLKRITALLLAIITIVIFANVLVSAQNYLPFTDVKSTDWFYNDVYLAYSRGLINGKSRDMFAPNDYLKYSEAVKLAACMRIAYFDEEPLKMSGKFWYEVYVDYCKVHGLIDKDYKWDSYATRADFMEIFAAALPDNALEAINAVEDGAIPDVPMYHKNADAIYKLYRAGIVQGADNEHRCNPVSNVKRSEVAAILTRMMYEYARLEFSLYLEDETDSVGNLKTEEEIMDDRDDRDDDDRDNRNDRDDNAGYDENEPSDNDQRVEGDDKKPNTNNSSKDENKKPEKENNKETETEKPEKNEPEPMPWEVIGAKQPKDYTYKEYNALTTQQKLAFQATFDTADEFNDWMDSLLNVSEKYPWENGGKQPEDYTWEEYEDLSATQQVAFQNTFKNSAAFIEWMEQVKNSNKYPWENGGKQPEDYTWEEYEALSAEMQMAFQNSFKNNEAFSAWMNEAKNGSNDSGNNSQTPSDEIPWENNGKAPEDYTWREFEKLTGAQQIAFQNYLGERGFEEWMERVQNSSSDNPWENGGKDPEDYTWAEFEALDGAQQIAFQNYLGERGFEEWMERVQNSSSDNPWENGGKDPEDYTWAEFEALDGAQQIAFQNYLGERGFEKWFNNNYVG